MSVTKQQVLDGLAKVASPRGVALPQANVLSEIAITDGRVLFSINVDAAEARALFESIESDSRATLDGMREIVGLLRGGDVALAPAPSVAHLDALLARHLRAESRLSVTGDPR